MAKLTDFQNPLTKGSGSVFDPSVWLGGILWVVMFGMIMAMGTKALNVIDSRVPGNQTPGMKPYIQPAVGNGLNVL
ncbi:hypothetical protein [Sinanaerobacter chloroacetimidivorans]|uniref:Uncharacterized protein n=1 Tax=Sinanaerobacter chloroacetimidivorans TaxID=2818044 RepID=A0A8J7VXK0_9FIRM|nr:hypothetical protein [Sinanaerobacter chloroacetimidivorans]MBR0596599.1 hypothetical protein [Sinanaerobacter chloroacetimidivorans]